MVSGLLVVSSWSPGCRAIVLVVIFHCFGVRADIAFCRVLGLGLPGNLKPPDIVPVSGCIGLYENHRIVIKKIVLQFMDCHPTQARDAPILPRRALSRARD